MGEQPHPWPLLQDQDGKSRHRNLIGNFFPDQTMSSPPRTPFRVDGGGRRMMVGLSEATRLLSRHVGRAVSSGGLSHLIAPQNICALSRYGVIRFDRSFYLYDGQKPQPRHGPARPMAG